MADEFVYFLTPVYYLLDDIVRRSYILIINDSCKSVPTM